MNKCVKNNLQVVSYKEDVRGETLIFFNCTGKMLA